MTFTKTLIAAAAASTIAFAAAPAAFAEEPVTMTRLVRYSDLDLASPEGQARLDARLRYAAARVCETSAGPHPLSEEISSRRCYTRALNGARQSFAAVMTSKSLSR